MSYIAFAAVVTLIAAVWLSLVSRSVVLRIKKTGGAKWVVGLMGLLLLIGGGGFFGSVVLAIGLSSLQTRSNGLRATCQG